MNKQKNRNRSRGCIEKEGPRSRGRPQLEARPGSPARASSGKDAKMHKNRQKREGTGQPYQENRRRCEWLPFWESSRPTKWYWWKEVSSLVGAQGLFPPLAAYRPSNHSPHLPLAPQLQTRYPSLSRRRLSLSFSFEPLHVSEPAKPTAPHKRSRADWTCSLFCLRLLHVPFFPNCWGLLVLLLQTPPRGIWRNMRTAGSRTGLGANAALALAGQQVEEACICTNGSWMTGESCRHILAF